jgi:GNAT superfamily N-acetyltransferase
MVQVHQPAAAGTLAQFTAYVRSRGVRATLRRLFRAVVFSREHYVLTYKPMDCEPPQVAARIPGAIRLADLRDLERLSIFAHHYTTEQFRHFIEQGRSLYVFDHEGQLLGYRLVNREIPRIGAARGLIRLEPTDTWVVNAYTVPAYRGARIGSALASYILAENRAAGFRREISLIRIDNEASRKMVGLAGAREMEEVTFTRLLGFTRYRIRSANARRYYEGGARESRHGG